MHRAFQKSRDLGDTLKRQILVSLVPLKPFFMDHTLFFAWQFSRVKPVFSYSIFTVEHGGNLGHSKIRQGPYAQLTRPIELPLCRIHLTCTLNTSFCQSVASSERIGCSRRGKLWWQKSYKRNFWVYIWETCMLYSMETSPLHWTLSVWCHEAHWSGLCTRFSWVTNGKVSGTYVSRIET